MKEFKALSLSEKLPYLFLVLVILLHIPTYLTTDHMQKLNIFAYLYGICMWGGFITSIWKRNWRLLAAMFIFPIVLTMVINQFT